ncbi:hypothetical protein N658DRAFT_155489 [Parathielavia hyrcaniae]|uniref:Uncharacterized protein n=1 Tax=Parathielavia hyrcaniae TaxID=113614 RepID=A0AAN6PXM1_9PEZI|nr:hypothetical protein N658DRAFT_155489 [Parathielavia hyrcaniae]
MVRVAQMSNFYYPACPSSDRVDLEVAHSGRNAKTRLVICLVHYPLRALVCSAFERVHTSNTLGNRNLERWHGNTGTTSPPCPVKPPTIIPQRLPTTTLGKYPSSKPITSCLSVQIGQIISSAGPPLARSVVVGERSVSGLCPLPPAAPSHLSVVAVLC